jgi:hypothetical protein
VTKAYDQIIAVSVRKFKGISEVSPTFWSEASGSEKEQKAAVAKILIEALIALTVDDLKYRRVGDRGSGVTWKRISDC